MMANREGKANIGSLEKSRRAIRLLSLGSGRLLMKSRSRRRALYLGGQGDANLGDEAMFATAVSLLADTALTSFAYAGQERRLAAVGLSGPRYFEYAVLGGGTLINPHWHEATRTALSLGLQLWSIGTGVGASGFGHVPEVEIADWRELLNDFEAIGVRGPLSRTRLEELGLSTQVDVVGDLALGLTLESVAEPHDPPTFAINFTLPGGVSGDPVFDSVSGETAEAVRELSDRGWAPVPIALHRDDVGATEDVLSRAGITSRPVVLLDSAEAFFDTVRFCSLTIGVRLHSAVLSACVGVPPLMLGYRDKCLDFMQSMDLVEHHVDLVEFEPGAILEKARSLADDCLPLREPILERARVWKAKLEDHARRLGH